MENEITTNLNWHLVSESRPEFGKEVLCAFVDSIFDEEGIAEVGKEWRFVSLKLKRISIYEDGSYHLFKDRNGLSYANIIRWAYLPELPNSEL